MNALHTWGPAEQNGGESCFRAVCRSCSTVKEWIVLPFRRAPSHLLYTIHGRTSQVAGPCLESAEARTLRLPFDE